MIEVALHDAEFFAYHGYYPEEQLLGNRFVISIKVAFEQEERKLERDNLEQTVNYEDLYGIAEEEMKNPRQLLETVAQAIADRIKLKFSYLIHTTVTVKKLNPPLKGRVRASSVTVSNYNVAL